MEIRIDGKIAAIKEGSSFDYVVENRAFTGADDYTLEITFPLAGCKQNLAIFGMINRKDVEEGEVNFQCDIRDSSFFKSGILTITSISEVEVKCQFLEGRSEQNFYKGFDEIYINELDLGEYDSMRKENYTPDQVLTDIDHGADYVCLPWVNNSSGNMQNAMKWNAATQKMEWDNSEREAVTLDNISTLVLDYFLSAQPYLIFIAKKICEAIGYTYDFDQWQNSNMRYIIICNAVPSVWQDRKWSTILPHWSVTEFFQQLEYLLKGEFDINHKEKEISFAFTAQRTAGINAAIENVVDKFSAEVTKEDESEYIGSYDLEMKSPGHRMWNFMSCDWYIKLKKGKTYQRNGAGGGGVVRPSGESSGDDTSGSSTGTGTGSTGGGGGVIRPAARSRSYNENTIYYGVKEFDTFTELRHFANQYSIMPGYIRTGSSGSNQGTSLEERANLEGGGVFYAKDIDTYFILFCYKKIKNQQNSSFYDRYYRLLPINQCGKRIAKEDNDNSIELGIIPAWLENVDDVENNIERGDVIFLECGDKIEGVEDYYGNPWSVSVEDRFLNFIDEYNQEGTLVQPQAARAIANGEKESSHEYFSCIYVGWWKQDHNIRMINSSCRKLMPSPIIDKVTIAGKTNILLQTDFCIRPKEYFALSGTKVDEIEATRKYSFSWLSKKIPNPRVVYHIHGKKYVCKKITATFTEKGMSQLVKAEMYRLKE